MPSSRGAGYTARVPKRAAIATSLGMALMVICGAAVVAGMWPAPRQVETATLRRASGKGFAAEIRLDRPSWLRPGTQSQVRLDVARMTASGNMDLPEALVARLSSHESTVLPGEEQAAALTPEGVHWRFEWTLEPVHATEASLSIHVVERSYRAASIDETLVWARFVTLDVRQPAIPMWLSLSGFVIGSLLVVCGLRRRS
ncbi:MAG TPA: hypothetical protein VFI11_00395 [Anaerolineales bacterium]|nr:hypothetical protein [Anaerolineales bacterium]